MRCVIEPDRARAAVSFLALDPGMTGPPGISPSRVSRSESFDGGTYRAWRCEGLDTRFDLAENDQSRIGNSFSILSIEDRHVRPRGPVANGPHGIVMRP